MISRDDSTILVLRRTFAATRSRVFRAWIEPAALESWLRPRGMRMTVRTLEARVGGSFHFELETGDSIIGTYREIVPPERLAFTWSGQLNLGWETIVTVDFFDRGSATEVVLTHEGLIDPERRARARSGWPSLLDALAEVLAAYLD
jgi:uncharacterized protein YndB with AHSA1/START domain